MRIAFMRLLLCVPLLDCAAGCGQKAEPVPTRQEAQKTAPIAPPPAGDKGSVTSSLKTE